MQERQAQKLRDRIASVVLGASVAGMATYAGLELLQPPTGTSSTDPEPKHVGARGQFKFEKFHPSDAAQTLPTVGFRGKVADLSRTGIYEFTLETPAGRTAVFVPSSYTTSETVAGLTLSEATVAGAGRIQWDSIASGTFNTFAYVYGTIQQTDLGLGIVPEEITITPHRY